MKNYKKSIIFMCAEYGGGIGKMLRFVIESCFDEFSQITLLHRGVKGHNNQIPRGIDEIEIPFDSSELMICWRFKLIYAIRKEILRINPNIICCFGSEMSVMLSFAMIGVKGIKVIQAERADPYTAPFIWKILRKWAFNRADYCVFQLEKQGRWYGNRVLSKSTVIPNAYIMDKSIENSSVLRKKTIVSVGRFVSEKRYEILIKSFEIVHKRFPDYKLIIYGDGPYMNVYVQLIKQLGLEKSVELPGFVNNPMRSIHNAGLFVLSSLYEGIPNVLIEALAMGLPTVSTDCTPGGPDFLTDHGNRGLLVPVDNIEAMASSICQIIESPELAEVLSRRGKDVIEILDEQKIAILWKSFFRNITV